MFSSQCICEWCHICRRRVFLCRRRVFGDSRLGNLVPEGYHCWSPQYGILKYGSWIYRAKDTTSFQTSITLLVTNQSIPNEINISIQKYYSFFLLFRFPANTTLTQCWSNVGPPSATLAQHQTSTGSKPRVCWAAFSPVNTKHLCNVEPTSKTLCRRCTNVTQMCLLLHVWYCLQLTAGRDYKPTLIC